MTSSLHFRALAVLAAVAAVVAACSETEPEGSAATAATIVDGGEISDAIMFFSDRSGNLDLWTVDPSDGTLTQITDHPSDDYEPDWGPGKGVVVFSSTRVNDRADLYLLDMGSGEVTQLTDTPDTVDDYSNFSPDGSLVVFQRTFVERSPVTAEIFVIDVATGEERQITDNEDWDSTPSFTPDGESVVFESNRTDATEIWSVRLDDLSATQVTFSEKGVRNSEARYSLDGSLLVYATVVPGSNGDLALLEAGSSEPVLLTSGDGDDGHGEFSPDGGTITFHRNGDIYLMDRDGSNVRPLTEGPFRDLDPHWH